MLLRSCCKFKYRWLAEPQLRLGPDESGITTSAAASGLVPAVMINNALLRQVCKYRVLWLQLTLFSHTACAQHFRQLTLQFLKAFNRYFHVDTVQIVAHLSEGNIGLYDDLALHFLPKFSEEVLLQVVSPCCLVLTSRACRSSSPI